MQPSPVRNPSWALLNAEQFETTLPAPTSKPEPVVLSCDAQFEIVQLTPEKIPVPLPCELQLVTLLPNR